MGDEHGPRAGCTFNRCGLPDDAGNCPFTRALHDPAPIKMSAFGDGPHQHDHRVPIEWKYIRNLDGGTARLAYAAMIGKRVTKLRCACGDVITV